MSHLTPTSNASCPERRTDGMMGGMALHRSPGYGWSVSLGHRVRWTSTRGTSRMWPQILTGADENCNRALTVMLWPVGHLDVWWEPRWRTDADGMCAACRAEMLAA